MGKILLNSPLYSLFFTQYTSDHPEILIALHKLQGSGFELNKLYKACQLLRNIALNQENCFNADLERSYMFKVLETTNITMANQ